MRKLLAVITLSITFFTTNAQTKVIDSFLGVKLGSTRAQVIAGLKLKGGTLDKENSKADILLFDNITLADRETAYVFVSFVDNKALAAGFVFNPEFESQTIDFYNSLVEDINKVYGDGTPTKEFKSPYEDGDGNEITALQTGSAEYSTLWGVRDEQQPGSIMAMINEKLLVILTYQDKKLLEIQNQRKEKKNKADL